MSRLRRAPALGWRGWWLLVRALALLLAIELSLRLRGFNRTRRLLARLIPAQPLADGLTPRQVSAIVDSAASALGLYRATCLRRALALWWLLRRRGVSCEIKIGALPGAALFRAHAWVEWPGGASDSATVLRHFVAFDHRAGASG